MKQEELKLFFKDKSLKEILSLFKDSKEDPELIRFVNFSGDKIINDHVWSDEYKNFTIASFRELIFIFKDDEPLKVINCYDNTRYKIIEFNDTVVVTGEENAAVYDLNTGDFIDWNSR